MKPLLVEISKQLPGIVFDALCDKELNTFGMRAECPVFAYAGKYAGYRQPGEKDNKLVAYICFTPGDLDSRFPVYIHGKSIPL